MNMRVSEEFGNYFVRLPLKKSATIVHGNTLQRDWREIVKPKELSYILGNPPFGGKQYQSDAQKAEGA
jgi:type I restriction-modification system DNA methylase subunit